MSRCLRRRITFSNRKPPNMDDSPTKTEMTTTTAITKMTKSAVRSEEWNAYGALT